MTDEAVREETRKAVDAVWRIESAKIVATLTRTVGDLDLAEDLAAQALLEAVEQWPATGVPRNPAAWLTSVATRRAIDGWRRRERLDERYAHFARELENDASHFDDVSWDPDRIDDDVLRLPSRVESKSAGGVDASGGGRFDHGRDCESVPHADGDGAAADSPREEGADRLESGFRSSRARRVFEQIERGPRSAVPGVQRRLCSQFRGRVDAGGAQC